MLIQIAPRILKIRYLNVQHWNNDKHTALVTHLTVDKPEIILFTSTSRTRNQGPIKIPFYNTFTTNRLITKRFEVVRRLGFLKKARRREMLTVREVKKRRARKIKKTQRVRVVSTVGRSSSSSSSS